MTTDTNQAMIEELATLKVKGLVPDKHKDFAGSLLQQFERKGDLSPKQWPWVEKIIHLAIEGEPEKPKIETGDLSPVYDLLNNAKANGLSYPKLRLGFPDPYEKDVVHHLVIAISGQKSKRPDTINMTDGGPFGNNEWYGLVSHEGEWEPPHNLDDGYLEAIADVLKHLSEEPEQTLVHLGQLMGHCCCCGKALSDPKSVELGIGPVCKQKFLG